MKLKMNTWYMCTTAYMKFKRLKGDVVTSTGKRGICKGEMFKPISNEVAFTWIGFNNPPFREATEEEIRRVE